MIAGTLAGGAAVPPNYEAFERVAMRLLFALIVWLHIPSSLAHIAITEPHGIARVFDLRFLVDPQAFAWCQYLMWAALVAYVAGIGWSVALPYLTAFSVLVGTVNNSRGAIGHSLQIVSLVLCAQTAAHLYSVWRRRKTGEHHRPRLAEDRVIWWSQQAIVATYFVSALTKLIRSSGMWFFDSPLIAAQIIKSNDQLYYNHLDPAAVGFGATIAAWMTQHPLLVGIVLSSGLFLELTTPLALFGRRLALGYGLALLLFHLSVHRVMKLDFAFNGYLLWVYLVNVPYWTRCVTRWARTR
ncbi:MAG TPA: hypothetical protein VK993_01305 [Chthoniobacterales bacterium]|nr:hypothetical protein [Chthoniobacterales bacterium]